MDDTNEEFLISEEQINDLFKDIIEYPENFVLMASTAGCIKVTGGRLPK